MLESQDATEKHEHDKKLGVAFLLATEPGVNHAGEVQRIALATETGLPNAPGREVIAPRAQGPESTASISGIVLDIKEGIVSGAKVTLETQSGAAERVASFDPEIVCGAVCGVLMSAL